MTTTKKTTTKRNFSVKANKLPANPFQHEILELADKQRSKAKRVEILKEYGNDALKALFIWNFDDSVISLLPDGHVPYKENEVPVGTDHTSLRREYKQLREGYGHIPKPQARKIKNYLNEILEDALRYNHDRRRGRRKKQTK